MTKSTRSISETGIMLVSTRAFRSAGTARRPLISTNVRCGPRPRRSIVAMPPEPLLVLAPMAGTAAGKPRNTSSTTTGAEDITSEEPRLVMGLLETAPTLLMREPVTSTRSTDWAAADTAVNIAAPPTTRAAAWATEVLRILNMNYLSFEDGCVRLSSLVRPDRLRVRKVTSLVLLLDHLTSATLRIAMPASR